MKRYIDKLLSGYEKAKQKSHLHPSSSPGAPRSAVLHPLIEPLSERELELLRLIAAGLSNSQMAETLVVTVGTIKWHLNNIYGKLDVRSRTQAVARARELQLL
jgi:LuxR family maltose regulon positive regulatory protein